MTRDTASEALNAVCPYFTMFPLAFPLGILSRHARQGDWVLDPFAGRGTTNYAARLSGLPSIGIDSSPVAVAVASAKLANVAPIAITRAAHHIMASTLSYDIPQGEFWRRAYAPEVLDAICRIRAGLLKDCRSEARKALRAVMLGALHGPLAKHAQSYLSNQCTRTYAPKPRYAVHWWRSRRLRPPQVDVAELLERRARRYFADQPRAIGRVFLGDSREEGTFERFSGVRPRWIITSPPYYGMRTYLPDQWIRNWFVGGANVVDYSNAGQLDHRSPSSFAEQLRMVWKNVGSRAAPDARLIVRFGGIADRRSDPLEILRESFRDTPWRLRTIKGAGSAALGRRQADQFTASPGNPKSEFDAWLSLR